MSHKFGSFITVGILVTGAVYGQGNDFSRFVVTGDSLTAGYQNAQLISTSQVYGYANVIATQAGVSLNLPLVPSPGYPQITIEGGFAVVTGADPFVFPPFTKQTYDLGVPGFTVGNFVTLPSTCPPDYTNAIAVMAQEILNPTCSPSAPTELQEAVSLKPTTAIMWIGNNDVLLTILEGTQPTSLFSFATSYNQAMSGMAHASKHLVVANIPDVTLLPYLTTIPELAAELKTTVPFVELTFGLAPGDEVTPYALPLILAMEETGKFTKLSDTGSNGPIVVRAATILEIKALVLAYNAIIEVEAAINGATVVDIYSYVNSLAANGVVVNGKKLTTVFGGGLFSADGVHPTNTGYALIANEFIKTMNRSLGTNVPLAPVN
jgi:phospholipase/lecithinase/hemolysin